MRLSIPEMIEAGLEVNYTDEYIVIEGKSHLKKSTVDMVGDACRQEGLDERSHEETLDFIADLTVWQKLRKLST